MKRFKKYSLILLAELTGTLFLLYFGCSGYSGILYDRPVSPLQAPLVWGFTVTSVSMIFGHISRAHFNPCITLCGLILGLITPITALVYVIAQMAGAVIGFWLLIVSTPYTYKANLTDTAFCTTTIHPKITIFQGLMGEFMATSVLIYAVCSAWDPRNSKWGDSVAIKFGFVVTSLIFSLGRYTGASLNPARSFGPAFVHGYWKDHWVYWIACLGASAFTTVTYKYIYLTNVDEDLPAARISPPQFARDALFHDLRKAIHDDKTIPKESSDIYQKYSTDL